MNIVHRDIKPSNVIYNRQTEKLTLVGFSLSKQLNSLDERMHQTWGTNLCMADEITNNISYDYSVDWVKYGKTLLLLFKGTVLLRITDLYDELIFRMLKDFDDTRKDLILRCIGMEENRIRSLEQIKEHEYFKDLKWDRINTESKIVKLFSFFRR